MSYFIRRYTPLEPLDGLHGAAIEPCRRTLLALWDAAVTTTVGFEFGWDCVVDSIFGSPDRPSDSVLGSDPAAEGGCGDAEVVGDPCAVPDWAIAAARLAPLSPSSLAPAGFPRFRFGLHGAHHDYYPVSCQPLTQKITHGGDCPPMVRDSQEAHG